MKSTRRAELKPLPYSRRRNRISNDYLWDVSVSVVANLRLEPTDVTALRINRTCAPAQSLPIARISIVLQWQDWNRKNWQTH